jgi:hypothetical protein
MQMYDFSEEMITTMAATCPHVWSSLFLTCKKYMLILSKDNPEWEKTFLECSWIPGIILYRFKHGLKYQSRVHRFGKPAVVVITPSKINGLAYYWIIDDVKYICNPVVAGQSTVIYAEYGLLHRADGPAMITPTGEYAAFMGLTCEHTHSLRPMGVTDNVKVIDNTRNPMRVGSLMSIMQRYLLIANHPMLYVAQLIMEMAVYMLLIRYNLSIYKPLCVYVFITLCLLIFEAY